MAPSRPPRSPPSLVQGFFFYVRFMHDRTLYGWESGVDFKSTSRSGGKGAPGLGHLLAFHNSLFSLGLVTVEFHWIRRFNWRRLLESVEWEQYCQIIVQSQGQLLECLG